MSAHKTLDGYLDFGPRKAAGHSEAVVSQTWAQRPYCDMCGPFRGRYLRKIGADEFGAEYRINSNRAIIRKATGKGE